MVNTWRRGFNGRVVVLNTKNGQQVAAWQAHRDWAMSLAFTPDGKFLATGCRDGTVAFWQPLTGKEHGNIPAHAKHTRVAFSPDGKTMATAGHTDDKTVKLWDVSVLDVAKIKEIQRIEAHTASIWSIGFARRGNVLFTAGNDAVRLWQPRTGRKR